MLNNSDQLLLALKVYISFSAQKSALGEEVNCTYFPFSKGSLVWNAEMKWKRFFSIPLKAFRGLFIKLFTAVIS